MTLIRDRFWDIAYAVLLILAVPAAIFHAFQERWPQAILVTAAAAIGAILLITGWQRDRTESARGPWTAYERGDRSWDRPVRVQYQRPRDNAGRYVGWLPLGLLSGFVATGIMTGALLLGYAFSAIFASEAEGANQLQIWFAALIQNTLTDVAVGYLAVAIGLHLIAGLAWAVIYTGLAEPRVSGTCFQRGVKFGLIPWALSITVFFPVVGAGFLGWGLGAGPLPILGNLIVHLVYGAALGKVYASNAVWDEPERQITQENIQVLEVAQKTMALGIIPGLVAGLIIGLLLSTVVAPDIDTLMAGVLGALVGSAAGVWIGSLSGLSPENAEGEEAAPAQRE
jgi:hypothetical protein